MKPSRRETDYMYSNNFYNKTIKNALRKNMNYKRGNFRNQFIDKRIMETFLEKKYSRISGIRGIRPGVL